MKDQDSNKKDAIYWKLKTMDHLNWEKVKTVDSTLLRACISSFTTIEILLFSNGKLPSVEIRVKIKLILIQDPFFHLPIWLEGHHLWT